MRIHPLEVKRTEALTEQIPDATGSHPHKHLIELRPRGVVERHVCLSCHSPGQQSLPCAWRANQQDSCTEGVINKIKNKPNHQPNTHMHTHARDTHRLYYGKKDNKKKTYVVRFPEFTSLVLKGEK